ncbi:sulfatase [Elizabethkingia anophelis]|uniref:LTA synthase family protein n=1 Tax=Elizabethkingia anophelis TaxID=1117645 RepID=UPI00293CCAFE|nr:sulfatase-like hydrolase/transferase [Elizabethkingia anophelis]MDV3549472.1 sulfatase [Elizabethkingia anophelis]MDV3562525.1 sulfatase [Elizabethkingia anophelis]MDV3625936.1 sulfatase [Elizabethkingia anophelis]MDV3640873.1 sulfatase [Elizabethkingia anophelis]
MIRNFRKNEYLALAYRLFLAYFFYFVTRVLFAVFNWDLLKIDSIGELLKLCFHGIAFDTTAILYTNALFILFSILPLFVNTRKGHQKFLMILYFACNLVAISFNFVDFIYYKFTFSRSAVNILESVQHESNKGKLFADFLKNYWYVFLLYFVCAFLWIFLYTRVKVKEKKYEQKGMYVLTSVIGVCIITVLAVGGIRGDFKKSTRPINLVDANKFVDKYVQANVVLNTPFCIIRTIGTTSFKKLTFMPQEEADKLAHPVKQYENNAPSKPNIVIFILESYSREYIGAFNKNSGIKDYVSYTPFLDSLSQKSMIFTNAYANGYKSIHGMSSVLSGIPSFKDAFTSSPYPNQTIQSLVSVLNGEGYDTSFFHGAPNGSMGFLGFGNILGFKHYYGKTEYNNDADFDGVWGIWDEPFFQYMNKTLTQKKGPFMSTVFSVTSHEPFQVPAKFKGKFPMGKVQMHQVVGYTDYALKKFFESASKEPWYKNTIFILTADHDNQSYYKEYQEGLNKQAVPIIIYKPDGSLQGVNDEWAQQIDIYPTVLDMIGYQKPFRSWGVSLFGDKNQLPFTVNYMDNTYRYASGNYICVFDGHKTLGFYDKSDKGLKNNLIGQRNAEMNQLELQCKAFLQDYFHRIVDKKLN